MMRKTLTHSFLIVAAGAVLTMPGAYAGAQSDDFFNNSDGGGKVLAHVPEQVKVPPTPEQAANLRYLEAQRQISDGSANAFADIPEGAKAAATPEQEANLRFLEAQRQISDGSGQWSGGSEPGASPRQMQARGDSGESAH